MSGEHETGSSKRDGPSKGRVLRAELIIAALALVTSACASVAAILQTREAAVETQATLEQTRIVSKQLGSSLWPYLTFAHAVSPTGVTLGFTNDGLGPALIRSFSVYEDRRPLKRLQDIADLVDSASHGRRIGESDLGVGSVIRPSEDMTILKIVDAHFSGTREASAMARAEFTVCYCSLLDDCWSLSSRDTEPKPVHDCPHQTTKISL